MDLKLGKKVYLVTGGSRGIGRAIVLCLLEEGACVATCARNEEELNQLFDLVPSRLQSNLLPLVADVLDSGQMEKVIVSIVTRFGKLNGIVANAGSGSSGGVLETSMEDWKSQYLIKVGGLLNTMKPAIDELMKAADPRIVIINGVTANFPDMDMAAVSASRAAVKQIANMFAKALAPQICVNTINIGVIDTDRQFQKYKKCNSSLSYGEWKAQEALRREIPLGRMGTAEEVAPLAAVLLSPISSYITGTSIDISGGLGTK